MSESGNNGETAAFGAPDWLQAFRVALMLANRREDCFCGRGKEHAGWIGCVEKEADRAIA